MCVRPGTHHDKYVADVIFLNLPCLIASPANGFEVITSVKRLYIGVRAQYDCRSLFNPANQIARHALGQPADLVSMCTRSVVSARNTAAWAAEFPPQPQSLLLCYTIALPQRSPRNKRLRLQSATSFLTAAFGTLLRSQFKKVTIYCFPFLSSH
jgi:hypothetical protein